MKKFLVLPVLLLAVSCGEDKTMNHCLEKVKVDESDKICACMIEGIKSADIKKDNEVNAMIDKMVSPPAASFSSMKPEELEKFQKVIQGVTTACSKIKFEN